MLGDPGRRPFPRRPCPFPSELVRHIRDVDAHRTGGGTQPVARAGDLAGIAIGFLQRLPGLSRRLAACDFPLYHDTGTGRERESAGDTVHFAESALDAFIDLPVGLRRIGVARREHRQGLEILEVAVRVVVEDHARIQDTLGVEDGLHPLHRGKRLGPPFVFHERRHVASGAVFGLQRSVVFPHHHFHHVLDHRLIAFDLGGAVERLVDDEMIVPLQRVSIDAGAGVAVPVQQGGKVRRRRRQVFALESDVLDEAGRPFFAQPAHGGEDARADGPHRRNFLRVGGEVDFHAERLQRLFDFRFLPVERRLVRGLRLRQHGGQAGLVFAQMRILHAGQRTVVQEFRRRHFQVPDGAHGLRRGDDVVEIDHRTGFERCDGQGLHPHLGEEGQRAFRPHQQMRHDLEGVLVGNQRPQVQAGDVLDAVFALDALAQRLVGEDFVAQFGDRLQHLGMRSAERRSRGFIAGIQHRTVGEHHPGADEQFVGIGVRAATHSGSIVADDAADHAAADRRGVGTEAPAETRKQAVYPCTDKPRLQADRLIFRMIGPFLPFLSSDEQDAVRHRLSGKRGPGRAESDRRPALIQLGQDGGNFIFRSGADDLLGHQPVRPGVGSPGQAAQFIGINFGFHHFEAI